MNMKYEIEIPPPLAEQLLRCAAETELSAEEIVEQASRKYLERTENIAE